MTAPVYATQGAIQSARRLLPGRVLENEVARALAGRRDDGGRDRTRFYLEGGVVAIVERSASPTTGRCCWWVKRVEAADPLPGENRMQTQSRRHQ
jgi:hypothetical protein